MNGNGNNQSPLLGPDNRPISQQGPQEYTVGPIRLPLEGDPHTNYQAAMAALDPALLQQDSQTLAQVGALKMLHNWVAKLFETLFQSTAMGLVMRDQLITHMAMRLERLEATMAQLQPGYQPPPIPTANDFGVFAPHGATSPVRIWPDPKGEYPTFKPPTPGRFRLGAAEVEITPENTVERREDGLYVDGQRIDPQPQGTP